MGVVTGHQGNRAVYTIVVLSLAWEVMATKTVPQEKDLQWLELHLVGPRVVLLYSDNSYSCIDLETLDREPLGRSNAGTKLKALQAEARSPLAVFPLGSAVKQGQLVSRRHLAMNILPEDRQVEQVLAGMFAFRDFGHVSQLGLVISHIQDGADHVEAFSAL